MKTYAIWKGNTCLDHKVIGYVELTEEQVNKLNAIPNIGVYFGIDRTTNPENTHK